MTTATAEQLARCGERQLLAALDADGDGDTRLRSCFERAVALAVEQSAAARVCIVEAGAGSPATDRVEQAVRLVGRRAVAVAREDGDRAELPAGVARAVLGGLRGVMAARLSERRERELPGAADELVEWALGYRNPPVPLRAAATPPRRPERRPAPTASPDEALLAVALEAYQGAEDWPSGVRDAIVAILDLLASEPAATRLLGPPADAPAAHPADPDLTGFASHLAVGLRRQRSPLLVGEAIAAALLALIRETAAREGTARMAALAPVATFVALAPAVGRIEACALANGD
ncbi:MAG: hypothetical protein GXY03_00545 [Solirubrobacterales bacterium]|nr:hypothetical protein [Solirubrobacterales bacterium]